jgi:hypothetical protein
MSEIHVPPEGALSIDQATEALMGPPAEPQDEASAPVAAWDDEDPSADEASQPADASEAEAPGDGEDEGGADGEAAEPLAAPAYWSKDAKARFADLPPDLQAVVLAQEGPREAAAARAKAEAAREVKTAREHSQGVQVLAEQLSAFLPEAVQTFQQRWGEPDWEQVIRQHGAEEAALLRARFDREQAQLHELAQRTDDARRQAHQAYMRSEFEALAQLDPELAPDARDPSQGSGKRQAVTRYLMEAGVDRNAIAQISALEMTLARKAMLWDQAQAAARGRGGQSPSVHRRPTPKPGARPGGAAAPPQHQGRTSAQSAFNAKPSIDNAVALLMARKR